MFAYQRTGRYFAQSGPRAGGIGPGRTGGTGGREVEDSRRRPPFRSRWRPGSTGSIIARACSRGCWLPWPPSPVRRNKRFTMPPGSSIGKRIFSRKADVRRVRQCFGTAGISHSHYAALRLKDAVADHFRERSGQQTRRGHRASRCLAQPQYSQGPGGDQPGHVRTVRCTAAATACNRSRLRMQETLAAAVVRLSGWQGERPLVDPMCGSGTLAGRSVHALLPRAGGLQEGKIRFRIPARFRRPDLGAGARGGRRRRSGTMPDRVDPRQRYRPPGGRRRPLQPARDTGKPRGAAGTQGFP